MNTAIISHASGATLRVIDGEQYDVILDGRHVGTIMDTSETRGAGRFGAHAFSFGHMYWGTGGGMRATRRTLDDAVSFILDRTP